MKAQNRHYEYRSCARIAHLVKRAHSQGVKLDTSSATALARLRVPEANCKLDRTCSLIRAGHAESVTLSFRRASRLLDICDGSLDEAIRRVIAGGAELRAGVPELVAYAEERGVSLTPRSISSLLNRCGHRGATRYIDKLAAIMDAASVLKVDCTQARATQRLSAANGDAQRVIASFAAERRRHLDRQRARCRVIVAPRTREERANAFAGCGCRRCLDRLAVQMQRYINRLIATPFFGLLDRQEARAEANLVLINAAEKWPGGHFTGYFAAAFKSRVRELYRGRFGKEREFLSLDASDFSTYEPGGRTVSLMDRVPDRSVDPLIIILISERHTERKVERHRLCVERAVEYEHKSGTR